ncbi:MAG: phosphoribosylglycinamide formyltransferase [Bacteroidia bacterium]|nr:MAG: phosphoribosylglycinamide formyltransferase [Bacteroidia bacterium]PIE86472.1 MAG: phosphoribosylglycinamide formyltransferase [Bacteroidia bacterium]
MKNIAIFASGSGTNAQNIVLFFKNNPNIRVRRIFSNKKNAYVLKRAENLGIPFRTFSKNTFYNTQDILLDLNAENIELIVLSGFLWLIPEYLIRAFPDRIINIHPALLPAYGGKGMYGDKVHEAVLKNNEKFSGITIHYVNEKYDDGQIIFQAKCALDKNDTVQSLANKVHELEYKFFPEVIKNILSS